MYRKHYSLIVSASACQGLSMDKYYLQTLLVLLLLLVNYSKSEVYLVCLFEVRFHSHHLRECFFGMLEGAIAVVENADSVPKFWLL